MTLRLRLLLVLVGIVAGGLIVSDVVTYKSLQSFLAARLDQQLLAAPGPVAHALEICRDQGGRSCDLPSDTSVLPGTYGQLRDPSSGTVLVNACFFNGHRATMPTFRALSPCRRARPNRPASLPSPRPVAGPTPMKGWPRWFRGPPATSSSWPPFR